MSTRLTTTPSPLGNQISHALVSRVLVDTGSGVSVIFNNAVEKMRILNNINKGKTTLHTFNGASILSRTYNHIVIFHVMDCPTPHNAIIDRN
ncbi:hypothetical protein D8674_017858 [Pyrus ussuriensis x Pyrus communis]|uniref:Peptidase A2 domain-containing protein n=1 Tax=Pyrus ussuriensis x Pyrus communis TaxID=2448454 RepID=A0A5N5HEY9_9ROSA|nr:hypothetical protein D8674_017858 [Pyrus ussuriensis x Pyrus communis]